MVGVENRENRFPNRKPLYHLSRHNSVTDLTEIQAFLYRNMVKSSKVEADWLQAIDEVHPSEYSFRR